MSAEFLVFDRNAKSVVPGSPFPSREAAESKVARLGAAENQTEGPNGSYEVVEVPSGD